MTRVVTDVVGWLDAKGFDCQQQDAGIEGLLLKVNKRGEGRNLLGTFARHPALAFFD